MSLIREAGSIYSIINLSTRQITLFKKPTSSKNEGRRTQGGRKDMFGKIRNVRFGATSVEWWPPCGA